MRQPREAVQYALEARRNAESMALVAFHFFATAIEAAGRVDLGEMHAATLLATTALGAVENLQGCEYGLEMRIALRRRAEARRLPASARSPPARRRLR